LKFIKDELWENNILRQGWGIQGLDLRRNQMSWIKKYMYNGKIFWNADINCNEANGRRNILRRMLDININDHCCPVKKNSYKKNRGFPRRDSPK